ncbi:hypothetical protein [Cytophaga aurantiaca]|uniref:hypothetical protein n=1 Tax=Cytophaga aurantiaca TaxID=29530 RepID=UPI000364A340|nr:hypothetical protein [Cytophaga aurantiaca]
MTNAILIDRGIKHENFVSLLLHLDLLRYFEYQGIYELCDIKSKEIYYNVFLKETSKYPFGIQHSNIEFIGYLSPINLQDLPIRGKSVILNITLKGWWDKTNKQHLIISKYPFFTDDLVFTKRLFEKFKINK